MNRVYIIIFTMIIFSCIYTGQIIYTDQVFGDSTSTINHQAEIDKLLEDEYQKSPFGGELNLYSILTILVVATVIILKFAITNTGWFGGQKKSDTYKEYEKGDTKLDYTEWSEERINDLKSEIKDQKRLLELLQSEVNKMIVDIKNHKEISTVIKDDVKEVKYDMKEQRRLLNDLEVKIAIVEKLFDRRSDNFGGGK